MKPLPEETLDQALHVAAAYAFTEWGHWVLALTFIVERERIQHGVAFWRWGWGARRDVIFGAVGIVLALLL